MTSGRSLPLLRLLVLVALLGTLLPAPGLTRPARASHTPNPTSVGLPGSFGTELGCAADWDPACAATRLTYDSSDDVWQGTWTVPPGSWEYKAALNGSWAENYGRNATRDGPNIPLALGATTSVKFYYDHKSHWITDNRNSVIATAPGSYQSELGCPGDWDPGCLRTWLQDPSGSGLYRFTTTALPAGSYEVKVTINESWAENYGQGGQRDGPNIPFTVPTSNAPVTFTYDPVSHVLNVSSGHAHDNNVEYLGLGHDSNDTLYRVPFGAITPGTRLILRFRTYHGDVTGVRVRFFDTTAGRERFQEMSVAAAGSSCYDPAQPNERCDFWETSYTPAQPTTLYYRFIVSDGTATAYYADDPMFDGDFGQATPTLVDNSYAVTVYDPAFQPISWLQHGVVYQIFPDRFRNGSPANDPSPTEPRYGYPPNADDQIVLKGWDELPEGHCRFYVNPATPCTGSPRGRDYFGGDLEGVVEKLDYLQALGVTAIYFNPVFESASNHGYDTQDYYRLDHVFARAAAVQNLIAAAERRGIRVILDGVFNHVSSDSPYFDRYGHFPALGACESLASPYRSWFFFRDVAPGTGPCAGSAGPNSATYSGWFGFDTLPVLDKSHPQVRGLVYAGPNAVATTWLRRGAAGWRLDVMGDPSFPADFWQGFRAAVKAAKLEAPIIGELWKKHEVLPKVLGDQADTAMGYRFRNAILGFFGRVDNKGFPDDGQSDQPPSVFARKLISIREDNPDASYYTMMNLLGSHDTQRILWALTPGENNREAKELDAANVARGKQLLRLAVVVQMTTPGAPAIYYGDEVGLTGDDDPDDRRPFPWRDRTGPPAGPGERFGVGGDRQLWEFYQGLIRLRQSRAVLQNGQLSFLLTDDANRTLAYLMRTDRDAALVAINRNEAPQTLTVNAAGALPDAVVLRDALGQAGTVTASGGVLTFTLPALSAAVLLPTPGQDLTRPAAPASLSATPGNGQVGLSWSAVGDAARYRIYRSPLLGGGYTLLATVGGTSYTDTAVANGQRYYYVVRAVDAAGNEGPASADVGATPAFPIGYAVLQWPKTLSHVLSVNPTEPIYGQVYVAGYTDAGGDPAGILAQVGFGPPGSDPATWTTWKGMTFNVRAGNNYEYQGSLRPEQTGTFDYLVRFSTDRGERWTYGDQDGSYPGEPGTDLPGVLTVLPNPDQTPPIAPANLRVADWSSSFITVQWDPVADAAEYWLYRREAGGSYGDPLAKLAAPTTSYADNTVASGATYTYAVRAADAALNLSPFSNEATQKAEPKLVSVTFRVRVPAETPPGDTVYLPGNIDLLGPWDPGKQPLQNRGGGIWEVTLAIPDGTALEYKYTRGTWDRVEWWGTITGLANRHVTVSYGTTGAQLVDNTATDWGNGPDETKAVQFWRDPLVASTVPANGATVPPPANVTVTFSRAVQPPAGGDFSGSVVVQQNGATVAGTVAPAGATTLVWTPAAPLGPGSYTVTVSNVRSDLGGDSVPMQQPYVFGFTVIGLRR